MISPEIYKPIQAISVPGRPLDEIEGVRIDSCLPFVVNSGSDVCLVSKPGSLHIPAESVGRLIQISSIHRRSYKLQFGETTGIYLRDEFGNLYCSLNTKGNNLENPYVYKYEISPSGFLYLGLQEGNAMGRVLNASRLIRCFGGNTELITKVIEPQQLPYKSRLIPVSQFKANLVRQVWGRKNKESANGYEEVPKEDITKLSQALENSLFLVTIRAMQVSERLEDLTVATCKEEFQKIIKPAFDFINFEEQLFQKYDPQYEPGFFDYKNEHDIFLFLNELLPKRIAHSFALMHNLGLTHGFPNIRNIILTGGLVDLDSVKGKSLGMGDKVMSEEDFMADLAYLLNTQNSAGNIYQFFTILQRKALLPEINLPTVGPLNQVVLQGIPIAPVILTSRFQDVFIRTYLEERVFGEDFIAHFEQIRNNFQFMSLLRDTNSVAEQVMMERLFEVLEWVVEGSEYSLSLDEAVEAFHIYEDRYLDELLVLEKLDLSNKPLYQFLNEYLEDLAEDPNKQVIDRLRTFLRDEYINKLVDELKGRRMKEFEVLVSGYGPDIAEKVFKVIANHLIFKGESLSKDAREKLEKDSRERILKFGYKYNKEMGWEDNLVPNFKSVLPFDISEIEYEEGLGAYLNYYLGRVSAQLGLEFKPELDTNSIMDIFLRDREIYYKLQFEFAVNNWDEEEFKARVDQVLYPGYEAYNMNEMVLRILYSNKNFVLNSDERFKIPGLEKKIGQANIEAILTCFVYANSDQIIGLIPNAEFAKQEKKLKLRVLSQLISGVGWEDDLAAHIINIDDLYNLFFDLETTQVGNTYLDKMADQIGWNYQIPWSREEFIEMFHKRDSAWISKIIKQALKEFDGKSDIDDYIRNVLKNDMDYENGHIIDRLTNFATGEFTSGRYKKECKQLLDNIASRYGSEIAERIFQLYSSRDQIEFVDHMPKDLREEVERHGNNKVDKLIKRCIRRRN